MNFFISAKLRWMAQDEISEKLRCGKPISCSCCDVKEEVEAVEDVTSQILCLVGRVRVKVRVRVASFG